MINFVILIIIYQKIHHKFDFITFEPYSIQRKTTDEEFLFLVISTIP